MPLKSSESTVISWDALTKIISGLTFLEDDDIVVKKDILDAARNGEKSARDELLRMLNEIELYSHGFYVDDGEVIVKAPLLMAALKE